MTFVETGFPMIIRFRFGCEDIDSSDSAAEEPVVIKVPIEQPISQ